MLTPTKAVISPTKAVIVTQAKEQADHMYWKYLKEREGLVPLHSANGFALVKTVDDCLYIQDIYVEPEHRQSGQGKQLLEMAVALARAKGLSKILGSCSPNANGATASLKVLLAVGFQLHKSELDIIYLIKPLQKQGM